MIQEYMYWLKNIVGALYKIDAFAPEVGPDFRTPRLVRKFATANDFGTVQN